MIPKVPCHHTYHLRSHYLSSFSLPDRFGVVISRLGHHPPGFDYDTDLSIQGVDVEIMISKADSGPGLSSKSLAGPFLSAQLATWASQNLW
jgi:hypothetical protein